MFSMNKYAKTYEATPAPEADKKDDDKMSKKSDKME